MSIFPDLPPIVLLEEDTVILFWGGIEENGNVLPVPS